MLLGFLSQNCWREKSLLQLTWLPITAFLSRENILLRVTWFPVTEFREREKLLTLYPTSGHIISVERNVCYMLLNLQSQNFCREKCLLHVTQLTVTELIVKAESVTSCPTSKYRIAVSWKFVICYSTFSHIIAGKKFVTCYWLPITDVPEKFVTCYWLPNTELLARGLLHVTDFQSQNCWREVCYML